MDLWFHKILILSVKSVFFFSIFCNLIFFSFEDKRLLYTCQFFDTFPRLCFLISLQHYLNYSLYQTIPSGVVNDAVRLRHLRKSFRYCPRYSLRDGLARTLLSTLRISAIVDSISCRGFIPSFFSNQDTGTRG